MVRPDIRSACLPRFLALHDLGPKQHPVRDEVSRNGESSLFSRSLQLAKIFAFWASNSASVRIPCDLSSARSLS